MCDKSPNASLSNVFGQKGLNTNHLLHSKMNTEKGKKSNSKHYPKHNAMVAMKLSWYGMRKALHFASE